MTTLRENTANPASLLPRSQEMTEREFFEFCQQHQELRIERNATGELEMMSGAGSETGNRNALLITFLTLWALHDGTGLSFDSSTGFKLPNGADRSPDAAWLKRSRWDALTKEEQTRFAPVCPDFVVELRSPNDSLKKLQAKMEEYLANGAQLGWLIDREHKHIYIYRPQQPVECLDNPANLSGETILPGFTLDLALIW